MADNIKNLVKRIQRYNAKKRDEIRPAASIQFDGSHYLFDDNPITVTATAERQLCYLARIPTDFYLCRMKPNERTAVFNRIFREDIGKSEYMFRFHADTLYGIVGRTYNVLDNIELVPLIREAAASGMNLVPVKSLLEPDHTKIRLVSESDCVSGLYPMLEFTNSENGLGSLQLHAGIFRLVCSNGLMVSVNSVKSRWIHAGGNTIDTPDFRAVLNVSQDYTQRLDATHATYLSTSQKIRILEQVSSNLGMKVGASFVRRANKEYHGGNTLFNVVNSITAAAAQDDFLAIQRTQIETFSSSLLN